MNKGEVLSMIVKETDVFVKKGEVKVRPVLSIDRGDRANEFRGGLVDDLEGLDNPDGIISLVRGYANTNAIRAKGKNESYPDLIRGDLRDGEGIGVGFHLLFNRRGCPFPEVTVLARSFSPLDGKASIFVNLGFGTELSVLPKKGDEFENIVRTYLMPEPRRGI